MAKVKTIADRGRPREGLGRRRHLAAGQGGLHRPRRAPGPLHRRLRRAEPVGQQRRRRRRRVRRHRGGPVTGLLDGLHVERPGAPAALRPRAPRRRDARHRRRHRPPRRPAATTCTCSPAPSARRARSSPPSSAHLEGAPGDPLAAHRREELRGAMEVLGVTHHLLAATARRRAHGIPRLGDGGLRRGRATREPGPAADLADAAAVGAAVIDDLRPDVVVTYDAGRWLRAPGPRPHPRGDLPCGGRVGRRAGAVCRADPPVVGRRGPLVAGGARAGRTAASSCRGDAEPFPVVGRARRGRDPPRRRPVGRAGAGRGPCGPTRRRSSWATGGMPCPTTSCPGSPAGRATPGSTRRPAGRPVRTQRERRPPRPGALPAGHGPAGRRGQRAHDVLRRARPRHDRRHPHLGLARPAARAGLRRGRDPVARGRARGGRLRGQRAGGRPAPALGVVRHPRPPAARPARPGAAPPRGGHRASRCSTAR